MTTPYTVGYIHLNVCISSGAFGKVCEGTWKDPSTMTEIRVAVKTLRSEYTQTPTGRNVHNEGIYCACTSL